MEAASRNVWVQSLPSDALLYVSIYTDLRDYPPALLVAFERVPRSPTVVVTSAGDPSASDTGVAQFIGEANYRDLQTTERLAVNVTDADGVVWVVRAQRAIFRFAVVDAPTLVMVAMPVRTDTLTQLRTNLIQTILAALIVFPLGVWLLAQRALAPLKRTTRAASRISSEDLSQRVPVSRSRDEVGELSRTLNRMLDRLQDTFETQRRFTADASHELRTPVTAISGHASYLLRRTNPGPEQVEPLTIIHGEAQRMSKLVNDLLELARADAGLTVRREPMNLVEIVEGVERELAPLAGNAALSASSPQPLLEVSGDASRLKQVVQNLVQNALNAGSSVVSVSLLREGNRARLEVLDNGPGIPEAALPNLFERFLPGGRGAGARAATAQVWGSLSSSGSSSSMTARCRSSRRWGRARSLRSCCRCSSTPARRSHPPKSCDHLADAYTRAGHHATYDERFRNAAADLGGVFL